MNNKYLHSVFYFTQSVYESVGKEKNTHNIVNKPAFKLLFKSVLINSIYKKRIGTHITFTTKQILDLVKIENYPNFKVGLLQLGSDIACPEESPEIFGDKDFRLIQYAVNKDGDILGKVKIVVDDYETKMKLTKIITEKDYPLKVISSKEALDEIKEIEKKLIEEYN